MMLSPPALEFRRVLIDALWPPGSTRFGYVDELTFIGECPLCGGSVGVRFAGTAPRATLNCGNGCSEAEIAAVLDGVRVRS
jgi:hypothetical protein